MRIEVETRDPELLRILLGHESTEAGHEVAAPGGGTLTFVSSTERRGTPGLEQILEFALHAAGDVAISLFASWLYDSLKARASAIVVGRKRMRLPDPHAKDLIETELRNENERTL